VARRVDQVQLVRLAVACDVPHAHGVELDRDAPLPLQVHRIQDLFPHAPPLDGLGGLEQAIGKGGLAVVDVGDDAEIADELATHGRI
jgi:hypothetical protein